MTRREAAARYDDLNGMIEAEAPDVVAIPTAHPAPCRARQPERELAPQFLQQAPTADDGRGD